MIQRLVCLIVGYLFGLFQTGYFVGLIKHRDIRNYGSGNSGTTNAIRVFGKKAGIAVFFGDFLKCIAACALIRWAAPIMGYGEEQMTLMLYAGLGVVLGHNFPFYLNFKGGKGIAASWALSMMVDWRLGLVSILVFIAVLTMTKYVSLASMLGTVSYVLVWWIFMPDRDLEFGILLLVITALAIIRHKDNIKRLLNGTENKIGQRVKLPEEKFHE